MERELFIQAANLEKQSEEMQQHLGIVEQQISELIQFKDCLSSLNSAENKEILSSLGKGVFAKTTLKDEKLFVNVGADVVLRKTPEEAKEIISIQLKNLQEFRISLTAQIEIVNSQLLQIVQHFQEHQRKASQ